MRARGGRILFAELIVPTVLRLSGLRFFFCSLEGSEPPTSMSSTAIVLQSLDSVDLAESHGFRAHELNRLRVLVIEHRLRFVEAWNDHFSG